MRRVLASGGDTVVAAAARADDLGVIDDHHRHKDICGVTVFTHNRRLNVCQAFTGCIRAVMAANAVASDVYVIEIGRQPANCAVAVIAIVAAGDMCRVLARGNGAIVAGAATSQNLRVIDG